MWYKFFFGLVLMGTETALQVIKISKGAGISITPSTLPLPVSQVVLLPNVNICIREKEQIFC